MRSTLSKFAMFFLTLTLGWSSALAVSLESEIKIHSEEPRLLFLEAAREKIFTLAASPGSVSLNNDPGAEDLRQGTMLDHYKHLRNQRLFFPLKNLKNIRNNQMVFRFSLEGSGTENSVPAQSFGEQMTGQKGSNARLTRPVPPNQNFPMKVYCEAHFFSNSDSGPWRKSQSYLQSDGYFGPNDVKKGVLSSMVFNVPRPLRLANGRLTNTAQEVDVSPLLSEIVSGSTDVSDYLNELAGYYDIVARLTVQCNLVAATEDTSRRLSQIFRELRLDYLSGQSYVFQKMDNDPSTPVRGECIAYEGTKYQPGPCANYLSANAGETLYYLHRTGGMNPIQIEDLTNQINFTSQIATDGGYSVSPNIWIGDRQTIFKTHRYIPKEEWLRSHTVSLSIDSSQCFKCEIEPHSPLVRAVTSAANPDVPSLLVEGEPQALIDWLEASSQENLPVLQTRVTDFGSKGVIEEKNGSGYSGSRCKLHVHNTECKNAEQTNK